jgi:hypothetical protein
MLCFVVFLEVNMIQDGNLRQFEREQLAMRGAAWLEAGGDPEVFRLVWPRIWVETLRVELGPLAGMAMPRYGTNETREKRAALGEWIIVGGDADRFEENWPEIWARIQEQERARVRGGE